MFCPRCGTEYRLEASYCNDCGAQLVPAIDPLEIQEQKRLSAATTSAPDTGSLEPGTAEFEQVIANSSGTGLQAWTPKEAQGWTFAGFVPLGLFALSNNITSWGLLALACSIVPYIGIVVLPLCWIYIGINGKKLAWKLRKFESREQFKKTMAAWENAGGIMFIILILGLALSACFIYAAFTDPQSVK